MPKSIKIEENPAINKSILEKPLFLGGMVEYTS